MPSSRGSSQFRDQTRVSCLLHWQVDSLPLVPPGKPQTTPTQAQFHPDIKRLNPKESLPRADSFLSGRESEFLKGTTAPQLS